VHNVASVDITARKAQDTVQGSAFSCHTWRIAERFNFYSSRTLGQQIKKMLSMKYHFQ